MPTMIAEATSDENNRARGGIAGDQKQLQGSAKEEVGVKSWYNRTGGWGVCLECTDEKLGSDAADIATRIAKDSSFGYDQGQRLTALSAIKAAGGDIENAADSELDCSVLVFIAFKLAGLNIEVGYTGNLESRFMATGKFIAHREPKYLTSGDYAKKGWIYLTAGKHTAIVVSNGSKSGATTSTPKPADDYASEADQIDPPYVLVIGGSVYVRPTPNTQKKPIYTAHRGEKLPFEKIDDATKWYAVDTPKGAGFITCKPQYTRLVTE